MISDFFPRVRDHADKLAVIGRATPTAMAWVGPGGHEHGQDVHRPPLARSWAVYGLGNENQNMPGYVVILDKRGVRSAASPTGPAASCPRDSRTLFRPTGNPILDLKGPDFLNVPTPAEQLDLLDASITSISSRAQVGHELARPRSLIRAGLPDGRPRRREAVDLSPGNRTDEADVRRRPASPPMNSGRNCLVARRAGGTRGPIRSSSTPAAATSTTPGMPTPTSRRIIPVTRRRLISRIAALTHRPPASGACSSTTLVVWGGELAGCRSAKVRAKKDAITTPTASPSGWPAAVSKEGITYGETDDFGFEAVVNKVHLP